MKTDVAIEEIRRTRRDISRQFGHDTKALIAHYKELQKRYADRLVAEPSDLYLASTVGRGPASRPA